MGLIKKPNELTVKNALSALIYGQPGMGKTTLALSSPQPLLLDFDGGDVYKRQFQHSLLLRFPVHSGKELCFLLDCCWNLFNRRRQKSTSPPFA